ncbi:MAG: MBL fold metallo-hydrolase [Paenibacillaceae bacterium]|nr:MBL fold metallo-hydrolase [Paenibacillaceae bacterium]
MGEQTRHGTVHARTIQDVFPRCIRVCLPAPFPLQTVNAYVFFGNDGVDIVDTGMGDDATRRTWEAVRAQCGFEWSDVRSIVLTHHHPDHAGCAGWLQQRTGAPVRAHHDAQLQLTTMWGDDAETVCTDWVRRFLAHGWPAERSADMQAHMRSFVDVVRPLPMRWQLMHAGQTCMLGNDAYVVIDTPGHARGHIALWDERRGVLFCGDHVLADITPNVSVSPGGEADPLQSYVDALMHVRTFHVLCAHPGHRGAITQFSDRVDAIVAHHRARLARLEAMIDAPMDAYACSTQLFTKPLTLHQWRFAMGEVIAHLDHLVGQGRIRRVEEGHRMTYQRRV